MKATGQELNPRTVNRKTPYRWVTTHSALWSSAVLCQPIFIIKLHNAEQI